MGVRNGRDELKFIGVGLAWRGIDLKTPCENVALVLGYGANEIQWTNMITEKKDCMSFFLQFFFHMNEFWNNCFCNLLW